MKKWKLVLTQGVVAGSLASILSTALLALMGRRETGSALAPIHAASHWYWYWGDEALQLEDADLPHTAVGYLTQHSAATFWATVYSAIASDKPVSRTTAGVLLGAAATSATAYLVDFRLPPRRFTPGYEHRLSPPALLAVHAALAVGLAAGALALRNQYRQEKKAKARQEEGQTPSPRIVRRVRAGRV